MTLRPEPPADLMVLPSPDGRFALFRRDSLIASVTPFSSVRDVLPAMAHAVATANWRSETDLRTDLADQGFPPSAVDELIAAARRKLTVMLSQPTVLERLTEIGHRNADGQVVVGRTDRVVGGQRVFVLRCTVCDAEYGAYGCDIDIRRCPSCQDGLPGVPFGDTSRS